MSEPPTAPLQVYIIAGEASGDKLGAGLMQALRKAWGMDVSFTGVGGELMQEEGLQSLFPITELSLMGLAEVLPHIPRLRRRILETVRDIQSQKPDIVVTIDSPGFCFRVGRRLKPGSIPIVHYVAPSVWAWKPSRAKKVSVFLDGLLTLLPFEPPYFEREGLKSYFVGHPVAEDPIAEDTGKLKHEMGLAPGDKLLCVLPGSRKGEISRHLPKIGETLARLEAGGTKVRTVIPTLSAFRTLVETETRDWTNPPHIVTGEPAKHMAFAESDAALAASGTVALELANAGLPFVVIYKMNVITDFLARRLVKLKWVNLVNILLDKEVVREHLLESCKPERIAPDVARVLGDEAYRAAQKAGFIEALTMLRPKGRSSNAQAADAVLDVLKQHGKLRPTDANISE